MLLVTLVFNIKLKMLKSYLGNNALKMKFWHCAGKKYKTTITAPNSWRNIAYNCHRQILNWNNLLSSVTLKRKKEGKRKRKKKGRKEKTEEDYISVRFVFKWKRLWFKTERKSSVAWNSNQPQLNFKGLKKKRLDEVKATKLNHGMWIKS